MLNICIPDPIDLTERGSLVGVIFIRCGNIAFPAEDWSDRIIILSWWADEISSLWATEARLAILRFMDGPYSIELTKIKNEKRVSVRLMAHDELTKNAGIIDLSELAGELRRALKQLLEKIEGRVESKDIQKFRSSLLSLP